MLSAALLSLTVIPRGDFAPVQGWDVADLPHADRPLIHPEAAWTVYLNREGGTYTYGWPDDAATNQSSIIAVDRTSVSPFQHGDPSWNEIALCLVRIFEPYDVHVTEEDPGDSVHVEAVIGGDPMEVGLWPSVAGFAPFDCQPLPNSIVFVFTSWTSDTDPICKTAAQEIGHAFGLDHEILCDDPMTYLDGCGQAAFQDEDASCGEWNPRPCWCGGETQNSHERLLELVGPHQLPPPPRDVGLPCDTGADCASGDCIDFAGTRTCGEPCDFTEPSAGCPDRFTCRSVSCGVGSCVRGLTGIVPNGAACGADEECASGLCADLSAGRVCAHPCDPAGAACEIGACEVTGDGCGGCGGVPEPKGLGAPCVDAGECASGICVGVRDDDRRCGERCDGAACGAGWLCEGSLCYPEGDGTLGAPCNADGDCLSGLCDADGYCTVNCLRLWSESTCPDDFYCAEWGAGDPVCVPNPGARSFGRSCERGDQCQSGSCADGRCSRFCGESAPCPPAWDCDSGREVCTPPPSSGCGCMMPPAKASARAASGFFVVLVFLLVRGRERR